MTITLIPARLRAIQYHDLRDALEDVGGAIPPDPASVDLQAIEAIEARVWSLQAHVAQLRQTVQQVENCEAVRGMRNDIGAAGYEWPWES